MFAYWCQKFLSSSFLFAAKSLFGSLKTLTLPVSKLLLLSKYWCIKCIEQYRVSYFQVIIIGQFPSMNIHFSLFFVILHISSIQLNQWSQKTIFRNISLVFVSVNRIINHSFVSWKKIIEKSKHWTLDHIASKCQENGKCEVYIEHKHNCIF